MFSEIEEHILLYSFSRYIHDHVALDLQKLISCMDESFSPSVLGCNPKATYGIVLDLWRKVINDEDQEAFWTSLYDTEKLTCMSGTIEKMIVMIGKLRGEFEDLPEPNPEFLRVQK